MSEIKIKIKDQEYTIAEARELYFELGKMFAQNQESVPFIPFVQPFNHPIYPLPLITYTDNLNTVWVNSF